MFFFFVLKQKERTKKKIQDLEKSNSFQSKNATIDVIYSIDIA